MAQRPPEIPSDLTEPPAATGAGHSMFYFAGWTIMACCGALYLAAVSIKPAFLDGYLPVASAASEQTAADIVNIRDNIGQLQTDVAKVQTEVAGQTETNRSLSDRVSALEQRTASAEGTPTASGASEPQRTGDAAGSGSDFDFPNGNHSTVAEAPPAKAKAQPKVINAPVETGSLAEDGTPLPKATAPAAKPKPAADKVAAFGAPTVKKPVGIRLATGASVDNLRISWGILSQRHTAELQPLQPRYYNNVDGNGITYELVAGPFKNTAEAKKVCQSLKAQAVDCQVGSFGGNAL